MAFFAWKVILRVFYWLQPKAPITTEILARIGIGLWITFKMCRACFR